MGGLEPAQDPGSVQKIVDQGIDRDQLHADFEPPRANVGSADQNAGQRHGEHLVRHAVDIAQWLNQSIARLRQRGPEQLGRSPGPAGHRSSRPGRRRQRRE